MVKPNTVPHCFISYQTIAGALRITIILVNKVYVFMMQYITHYREKQYTWMNKLMAQTLHFYNCTTKNAALFTECGINLNRY